MILDLLSLSEETRFHEVGKKVARKPKVELRRASGCCFRDGPPVRPHHSVNISICFENACDALVDSCEHMRQPDT